MKARVFLLCMGIVCALLQISLVLLDEFNPLMGFLTALPPKLFLLGFSLACLILSFLALIGRR